jgi:hypothetical protein
VLFNAHLANTARWKRCVPRLVAPLPHTRLQTALIALLFAFDRAKQDAGCDAQSAVEQVLRVGRKIQSEFRGEQIEMLAERGDRSAAYLRVETLGNERAEKVFAQQRQESVLFLNHADLPLCVVQDHPLVFIETRLQPLAPQRPDALSYM